MNISNVSLHTHTHTQTHRLLLRTVSDVMTMILSTPFRAAGSRRPSANAMCSRTPSADLASTCAEWRKRDMSAATANTSQFDVLACGVWSPGLMIWVSVAVCPTLPAMTESTMLCMRPPSFIWSLSSHTTKALGGPSAASSGLDGRAPIVRARSACPSCAQTADITSA